jgi:hypothetical protein
MITPDQLSSPVITGTRAVIFFSDDFPHGHS